MRLSEMLHRSLIVPLVVATTVAAGCGGGPPARGDVLADLVDDAMVPAYELLAAETAELAAATTGLCDALTPSDLVAARGALVDARAVWSYTEPMWVGPVMERRSWAVVDWPIARDEIEALIADTTIELDAERLGRRIGADQRGLGAVEYILGRSGDDEAVLEALGDERRCRYLTGITALIADETALILADWTMDFEGSGPYQKIFTAADGDGLDKTVNNALFLLEAMTDRELGLALGEMGREPDLEAIVEGSADLAVADLIAHLDGLKVVLIGNDTVSDPGATAGPGTTSGPRTVSDPGTTSGLGPLLEDDLTDRLREQLETARRAVVGIDPPIRAAVIERTASVRAARDAIKVVQVTVATEVVSRLGVTIGFSDADGDTGS